MISLVKSIGVAEIITILLITMCIVALIQPNMSRLFGAVIFAGLTMVHDIFLSDLDGLAYYGSAALTDSAIIMLTSGIFPIPVMVVRLHYICLISILVNAIGWVMWMAYLSPIVYNMTFMLIYFCVIITMIRKDTSDVRGGYQLDDWRTIISFNRITSWRLNHQSKGPS